MRQIIIKNGTSNGQFLKIEFQNNGEMTEMPYEFYGTISYITRHTIGINECKARLKILRTLAGTKFELKIIDRSKVIPTFKSSL